MDEFVFEMGRAWSRELGMALKKGSDTEKVHTSPVWWRMPSLKWF